MIRTRTRRPPPIYICCTSRSSNSNRTPRAEWLTSQLATRVLRGCCIFGLPISYRIRARSCSISPDSTSLRASKRSDVASGALSSRRRFTRATSRLRSQASAPPRPGPIPTTGVKLGGSLAGKLSSLASSTWSESGPRRSSCAVEGSGPCGSIECSWLSFVMAHRFLAGS